MFVVVGEALIDLVGQGDGRTYVAHPGGSPANVALGLARLGDPVVLRTRIGDDAFGRVITSHLAESGVRVEGTQPGANTSLAVATLAAGVATYDFRIDWDLTPDPLPAEATCLHTGSLATVIPPGAGRVIDLMERERRRGQVTVSYDPNVRPALLGVAAAARGQIERLVAFSDVVKASDEDLRWLYPDSSDDQVARRWLDAGPALVVVTRGGEGVYALTAAGEAVRPAPPVDVVDTVGAGDSFTAGLLHGLGSAGLLGGERRGALAALDAPALAGIVEFAAGVAAVTCSRPGADPPTRAEMPRLRRR